MLLKQLQASVQIIISPKHSVLMPTGNIMTSFMLSSTRSTSLRKPQEKKGIVKLPSYHLFDVGASYKFTLDAKKSLTLRANVYNLFNKYYISELSSNIFAGDKIANGPDAGKTYQEAGRVYQGVADGNTGFLGFGRTFGLLQPL